MRRPAGIQAELVTSLALIMVLAVSVLTAILFTHHEARLREVLGRTLTAEARDPRPIGESLVPGAEWWTLSATGITPRGGAPGPIDAKTLELAERARKEHTTLIQPGPFWGRIRFATELDGVVVAGRLPRSFSLHVRFSGARVALVLLLLDVVVFTVLGATLIRRRVAAPLQRLVEAVRQVASEHTGTHVAVEGGRETQDLARAFNDMSDALEERRDATEKALAELRTANRELRSARVGLDRAERLAAVGRLAAGVAHEVGNPIGAMLALLDLAGRDPGLGDEARGHLARAGQEGERVRKILRQVLDFSRPSASRPELVDLATLAHQTVDLLRPQRRFRGLEFEVIRGAGTTVAHADPGAVAQILINLLLNAADAVHDQDGGWVRVEIGPAVLETREGDDSGDAIAAGRPPDAVECRISDSGPGIPEEDRERIFDPFFTTRPPGEGTGLGLANAARLAEDQQGALELVSDTGGGGAVFSLKLPMREAANESGGVRGTQHLAGPQNVA